MIICFFFLLFYFKHHLGLCNFVNFTASDILQVKIIVNSTYKENNCKLQPLLFLLWFVKMSAVKKKSSSVVNLCEGFKRVNVRNHIFNPGTCVYCMLSAFCMFSFKKTMLQCTFKNLNNPNQPSPIVRPVTAVTSIHFGRRGAWISDLLTTVLLFFFTQFHGESN